MESLLFRLHRYGDRARTVRVAVAVCALRRSTRLRCDLAAGTALRPVRSAVPEPRRARRSDRRDHRAVADRAGSVVLPLHDPIRVAEEWAVLDNLSGGRIGVSFASGWHTGDFVLAPENKHRAVLVGQLLDSRRKPHRTWHPLLNRGRLEARVDHGAIRRRPAHDGRQNVERDPEWEVSVLLICGVHEDVRTSLDLVQNARLDRHPIRPGTATGDDRRRQAVRRQGVASQRRQPGRFPARAPSAPLRRRASAGDPGRRRRPGRSTRPTAPPRGRSPRPPDRRVAGPSDASRGRCRSRSRG